MNFLTVLLLCLEMATCSRLLPTESPVDRTGGQLVYPVKNFENRIRSRRSYADAEASISGFLDDVDFYLEKIGIIRYIILDCRQLYQVLKADVIQLQLDVALMQADGVVTATEVLDLIDECTRFIVSGSTPHVYISLKNIDF